MAGARRPVLAIDFGTANSVAVLFDGHDFDKVTDPAGRFIMPSSVFYTADRQWLVGWDAAQMGMMDPGRYKAELKRELEVAGTLPLGDQSFARIELIGQILSFLREQAEQRTGATIHQAVLTVPAAYDEYRCQLMADAARIAGFDARITTEPEAAAFSEGTLVGDDPVLVYDLGAGTFDAAVVQPAGGGFKVIGHAGLPHCGGLDVDRLIYNYLRSLAHHPSQQAVLDRSDDSPQARARRLQFNDECRQKKELLSAVPQVTGNSLVLDPPLAYTITRDWLETAQRPMLLDTIRCCRQLLGDCGLDTTALGHILLVGGSTHAPIVSRLLQAELDCEVRRARVPETAVAEGASRWGWDAGTSTASPQRGSQPAPREWPETFDVMLTAAGGTLQAKLALIKVLQAAGLEEEQAVALVDHLPSPVKTGLRKHDAETLKADLEHAGATAELHHHNEAGPGQGPLPAREQPEAFDVVLTAAGDTLQAKLAIVKVLQAAGLEEEQAVALVDHVPSPVKAGLGKHDAETLKADLEHAGATAQLNHHTTGASADQEENVADIPCMMCNAVNRIGAQHDDAFGFTCRQCGSQLGISRCNCGEEMVVPFPAEKESPLNGSSWRHTVDTCGLSNLAGYPLPNDRFALNCNNCGSWNSLPEGPGFECWGCKKCWYILTCESCNSDFMVADPREFFRGAKELAYECAKCKKQLSFTTVPGGPPAGEPIPVLNLIRMFPLGLQPDINNASPHDVPVPHG